MANISRKYNIEKLFFPVDGYEYNAQVLISIDGGNHYYYTGIGRFTKTKEEAIEYCKRYEKKHEGRCA